MTQCSEFRREMSTHGRRGLLYIYIYVYTQLLWHPWAPVCPVAAQAVPLLRQRQRQHLWFYFIYKILIMLSFSSVLPLSLSLCRFSGSGPARWWYLQFFAYICRIVRATVSRGPKSLLAIRAIRTRHCPYLVLWQMLYVIIVYILSLAHWSCCRQDSHPVSLLCPSPPPAMPHASSRCETAKRYQKCRILITPRMGHISCATFCALINPF